MHAPHPATAQLGKYLYLSFTGLQLAPQKPLLFARIHKKNFSLTRRDMHIFELKNWLNDNYKLLKKTGISLRDQKLYLFKLELKKFINNFFKINI